MLGTLVPELPSQAKAYLPSLAEERPSGMTLTDEEIEAMLDELVDLKSMA